jgi:aminopeptidase
MIPVLQAEELDEILLQEANDEQLTWISPNNIALAEEATARLHIYSQTNTKALSAIDPARTAKRNQAASNRLREIRQNNGQRWCLTLYPTEAYAQDSGMSLRDFEDFVFNACFLDDPDPIARWQELSQQQQFYVDWLKGRKSVHVLGQQTDITLSIADRTFINSDGLRNFPSGEFYTGPVENSANGVIEFSIPTSVDGRAVEGVRLAFRDGKVVEATAQQGDAYLQRMLESDAGAKFLGEFAFGNNSRINRGTRNILFDEKMGGTIHMALGRSYPETGGLNKSAVHWDMICDLRTQGEVWVDDILFLKNGQFMVGPGRT